MTDEERKESKRAIRRAYYARHSKRLCAEKAAKWRVDIEASRAKNREYHRSALRKEYRRAREQLPEVHHRRLELESRPEARAKQREKNKRFRDNNPERAKALTKDWLKRNPEWLKHKLATRAALRRGASGSHTQEEWLTLCAEYGGKCAYCRSECKLSRDHVMPLTRGGSDSIDNILPACRSCNSSKGNRVMPDKIQEWMASRI